MKLLALTDIGVSRADNQDNFWCARLDVDGIEVAIICLCDGMGGMNKGGLASKIVTESVKEYFNHSIDFVGLSEVVQRANSKIYEMGVSEGHHLGTTCTILLCTQGSYKILHVGDSRCYKIDIFGNIHKVTKDHSALEKYNITFEDNPEAFNKYKSMLTRCIGVKNFVNLDTYEGQYIDGDRFLVCSDGFWHYLEYGNTIGEDVDLRELIDKCIECGEQDNITVGLLSV